MDNFPVFWVLNIPWREKNQSSMTSSIMSKEYLVYGIKYVGKMIQVNKGLVPYHFPHGNTPVLQCCISEKPSYFQ